MEQLVFSFLLLENKIYKIILKTNLKINHKIKCTFIRIINKVFNKK